MQRVFMSAGVRTALALATLMLGVSSPAWAQLGRRSNQTKTPPPPPQAKPAEELPALKYSGHLVSPTEAIAIVNGEAITRQQLADECVAQKGTEVLETLILRKLIDQGLRSQHLEVTPSEIDAEIDHIAMSVGGVSREAWLAMLSKERKLSPARYARDVIYPMLALRKLSAPSVQVTEQDIEEAFQSKFGEKVKCRMILLNSLPIAKNVWEDLKKSPDMFEKIAQEKSIDPATRSVGGMLPEPIARHAHPRAVSDRIFKDLVEVTGGDANAPNTTKYKPKDGDISGIIQVTEATWAIFRRESLIPAQPYDSKDPEQRKQIQAALYESKLQERIGLLLSELMRAAAIENRLTGQIKLSREEEMHAPADAQIQRSATTASPSAPPTSSTAEAKGESPASPTAAPGSNRLIPAGTVPAAVSSEDAKKAESLRKK